jgi:hypothetical protein
VVLLVTKFMTLKRKVVILRVIFNYLVRLMMIALFIKRLLGNATAVDMMCFSVIVNVTR